MDSSEMFPTRWLSAEDVGNREVSVVVEDSKIEMIGDDKKLVLYYVGFDKGHVLNKTNWKKIKEKLGAETNNWKDANLVLYTALVPYKGEDVPALRLKFPETGPIKQEPQPPAAQPQQPAQEPATAEQPKADHEGQTKLESPKGGSSAIDDAFDAFGPEDPEIIVEEWKPNIAKR